MYYFSYQGKEDYIWPDRGASGQNSTEKQWIWSSEWGFDSQWPGRHCKSLSKTTIRRKWKTEERWKNRVCYITGISNSWSRTHSSPVLSPQAPSPRATSISTNHQGSAAPHSHRKCLAQSPIPGTAGVSGSPHLAVPACVTPPTTRSCVPPNSDPQCSTCARPAFICWFVHYLCVWKSRSAIQL